MLFDTHVHLCEEKFDADRERLIANLRCDGVGYVVDVGENVEYSKKAVELAESYEFVYAAVGAHPYYAKEMTEDDIDTLKELAKSPKAVAIGEIGLDYHEEHDSYKEAQKVWFKRQIRLAQELDLPFIVHDRDAHEDCLEIFREVGYNRGIIHCFSGDAEFAKTVCDMGFYVAFGGAITYKNSTDIQEAAQFAPIDRILIETDCPFLTPDEVRGKRNEPKYVQYVAEKIAELRGMSYAEVVRITNENARRVFGI